MTIRGVLSTTISNHFSLDARARIMFSLILSKIKPFRSYKLLRFRFVVDQRVVIGLGLASFSPNAADVVPPD